MTDAADLPAHSENSPSAIEGWSTCEDYINANRGLPDDQSWEAAEGTAAHWIRNECMTQGLDADGFIGHIQRVGRWDFEWTEDDAWLTQQGIDWLRSHAGTFYGEHRVDTTPWVGPDSQGRPQGGTLDGAFITDELIIVDDFKYGRGVPVYAERNKQLMLYALAFWHQTARHVTRTTRFLLNIDQPRHAGGGGRWETTLDELLAFGEWVKERAAATRAPNPPRKASVKGCMWCRRKNAPGGCATLDAYVIEQFGMEFEDLDNPPLTMSEGVTPERRRVLIEHRPMIEDWLERMAKNCLADALAGAPTGGLKAVAGTRQRDTWHDEKGAARTAAESVIGDRSFNLRLKTPNQMSKEVSPDSFDWLLIEPHIKRGLKPPVLVPEEDARPAITSGAEFEDLD